MDVSKKGLRFLQELQSCQTGEDLLKFIHQWESYWAGPKCVKALNIKINLLLKGETPSVKGNLGGAYSAFLKPKPGIERHGPRWPRETWGGFRTPLPIMHASFLNVKP